VTQSTHPGTLVAVPDGVGFVVTGDAAETGMSGLSEQATATIAMTSADVLRTASRTLKCFRARARANNCYRIVETTL